MSQKTMLVGNRSPNQIKFEKIVDQIIHPRNGIVNQLRVTYASDEIELRPCSTGSKENELRLRIIEFGQSLKPELDFIKTLGHQRITKVRTVTDRCSQKVSSQRVILRKIRRKSEPTRRMREAE
jgi:hypothetical protein